jgi:hypothetical protein
MNGDHALSWRPLSETDLPAVTELARECLTEEAPGAREVGGRCGRRGLASGREWPLGGRS